MKIKARQFKKISIRGCVAYGICCLENALEHYNLQGEGWNFLLRKLWWYTVLPAACDPTINNCLPLERWWALISEIFPKYHKDAGWDMHELRSQLYCDEDIPDSKELELLLESYKQTNNNINLLVKNIFDIGSNDLWAGIGKTSPNTLIPLQELIDLMYEQQIPLPSIEPFKQYVFHKPGWDYDLHAYGEMFDGTQYSKLVKNTK